MKRKGKTIFLLSLLLLLAACEKEEPTPTAALSDETIRFGVPGVALGGEQVRSRAGEPVDEFPTDESFGVLGYCLAQTGTGTGDDTTLDPATGTTEWQSKAPRCTPHLFYKTKVTYNGMACYYTGEQRRWYEAEDYLYSFFAYYPYGDEYFDITPENATTMGAPVMRFNMPFEGGTTDTERKISEIPDAMMASSADVLRGDGHVGLRFYHLLTGLNFTVHNYNEANAVTIHGLRIKGTFYRSIEVAINSGINYPTETYGGTFTFLDGDDGAVEVSHDTPAERIGGKNLMLVANLNATPYLGNDIGIYLDYEFMGESKDNVEVGSFGNFLPTSGTIYTVELNFIGDAFVLNVVVDNNQNWESGGDSDINFQ